MACNSGAVPFCQQQQLSVIPAGLQALYTACGALYTDQPNPLQVAAVVKYWLGGPDPLDYISMYSHAGDPENGVPPHWHYVSFGLSDLHGDGRVHDITAADTPSGFGFELTFRLRKEEGDAAPPTWPAAVMQGLAKYVFQSDNVLCEGDHVSWHCPLDNSESRIQHMLMTLDPQLRTVQTPFGPVQFIQIVGVCNEELKSAQHWNGRSFLDLMKGVTGAGGPWLVTDMRRGESVFELDTDVEEAVQMGISEEGSDLSGVGAKITWSEEMLPPNMTTVVSENPERGNLESPTFTKNEEEGVEEGMPVPTKHLKALHIQINLEAGLLLPLMLKGRLHHGRHFTFKSALDSSALTFVVASVQGAFVTEDKPFGCQGQWCQVLIQDDLLQDMIEDLDHLAKAESQNLTFPKTYSFPHHHMSITILPEDDF